MAITYARSGSAADFRIMPEEVAFAPAIRITIILSLVGFIIYLSELSYIYNLWTQIYMTY